MQTSELASRKCVRPLVVGESCSPLYGRWIYLAAFFLYVFASWMSGTTYEYVAGLSIDVLRKVFYALALGLLFVKFTLQAYEMGDLVRMAIPGLVFALSAHVSGERVLLWAFLFIAAAQDIDVRDLAAILLLTLICIGTAALVGSLTGIIELRIIDRDPDALRYALGFLHPNTLSRWAFLLFLSYFSLRDGHVGYGFFLGLALTCIAVSAISRSLTGMLVILVFAALALLRRESLEKRYLVFGSRLFVLFCILISFAALASLYFMFFYDFKSEFMVSLSDAFSMRLQAAHSYYLECGTTLFGYYWSQPTALFFDAWGNMQSILVDMSICRVYLQYGIVACIIVCASYTFMLVHECKGPLSTLGVGLSIFAFFGLSEYICFSIENNFFLVSISKLIYPNYVSPLEGGAPELMRIPAIKQLFDAA